MRRGIAVIMAALLGLAACGEESPTDVGGTLLPGQAVRTYEVILEPGRYLLNDTAFSGYLRPFTASFVIVANDFEGVADARTIARFTLPSTIGVRDSAGVARTDSAPRFFSGELVLRVDTTRSTARPATVSARQATERWDPLTATWLLRVDTGTVELPWAQPGGSPGAVIDSSVWSAGDSIIIRIDSARIVSWRDTANVVPGVVVTTTTNGARLRFSDIQLRTNARSSINRDTVVTTASVPQLPVFIFDPPVADEASSPRVGGLPAWRTIMRVRDRLDTLRVPCADGAAGCTVPLTDVSITHAALLMKPQLSPAGFSPEDSVQIGARLLLVDPLAPLRRSALGEGIGVMNSPVPPSVFRDASSAPVEVPITEYLRRMTADSVDLAEKPPSYVALVPVLEGSGFGFASFEAAPRLRLILTVATELQLR